MNTSQKTTFESSFFTSILQELVMRVLEAESQFTNG